MSKEFWFEKKCRLEILIRILLPNKLAGNVEALAMWRYSVLRLPGAAAD